MSGRAGATVTETPGSHAIYVSNPTVVVEVIERAAYRKAFFVRYDYRSDVMQFRRYT